jgi:hypothetical protein
VSKTVEQDTIAVVVENGRLVPADQFAQELIGKLPLGRRLIAVVNMEEPTDQLRNFYFAGIGLLFQNIDGTGPGKTWPTANSLRKYILKEIGFAEPVIRVDGVKWVPVSMARGEMSFEDMTTCLELSRAFVTDKWGWDAWADWSDAKELEKQRR